MQSAKVLLESLTQFFFITLSATDENSLLSGTAFISIEREKYNPLENSISTDRAISKGDISFHRRTAPKTTGATEEGPSAQGYH